MAANEILPFAGTDTGTNLLTQSEYNADAQRLTGNQPGIARSKLVNKALRQSSLMSAAVAQFMADNQTSNVTDNLSASELAGYLADAINAVSGDDLLIVNAGGTADALTATFAPALTAYKNGFPMFVRAGSANTTATPTINVNGLGAKTIVKGNNLPLVAGDIAGAGHWLELQYDTSLDRVVLQNPANGVFVQNQIQPLSATVTTGAITSTINTNLDFKNTSLLPGGKTNLSVSNSGTIPLAASLGFTTAVAGRILVLEFYNGGTPVMGWVNANSGLNLDESGYLSPTTISAGATSATTVYSASAVSANSPYRVIGYIDAAWTSGTGWVLSNVQGADGRIEVWSVSSNLIYSNGVPVVFAHNYGAIPKEWSCVMVVTTANNGLAVGQEIPVSSFSYGNIGQMAYADADNLYFIAGSSGADIFSSAGASYFPTPSNFRIKFYWR